MTEWGSELRSRWPAPTPTDAELEALAGQILLRAGIRAGRRRARARLAVDSLVRSALAELDGAAAETPSPLGRSSGPW
ncbi:hypothetical protein GCM10027200_77370 [Lentzea nigeriaca]